MVVAEAATVVVAAHPAKSARLFSSSSSSRDGSSSSGSRLLLVVVVVDGNRRRGIGVELVVRPWGACGMRLAYRRETDRANDVRSFIALSLEKGRRPLRTTDETLLPAC